MKKIKKKKRLKATETLMKKNGGEQKQNRTMLSATEIKDVPLLSQADTLLVRLVKFVALLIRRSAVCTRVAKQFPRS